MAPKLPGAVDTVIVGNGPAALILSYVLHGHIPRYIRRHPDQLIDSKISSRHDLLDLSPDLYEHLSSSLRYSNQALPINTLLDTLIRPNADTEVGQPSCVEWTQTESGPHVPVSHIVLGAAPTAGGQWAENPVQTSDAIGALSYAEMLSLPGYSYADHYSQRHGTPLPEFQRPSRDEVADYYATYPAKAGIDDVVHTSVKVQQVSRITDGFVIKPQNIRCRHLVLASGVFSVPMPPPRKLEALTNVDDSTRPLLVIGSGFSAADVIITERPSRKIIHAFHWDPEDHPSPLKGCHYQAYPEYASIYRHMKKAAASPSSRIKKAVSPSRKKKTNPFFAQRDWTATYEGLPNSETVSCNLDEENLMASVTFRLESGELITREVGGLAYVVGRRGSLDYLDPALQAEVFSSGRAGLSAEHSVEAEADDADEAKASSLLVSGRTLRPKAEVDLEVAPSVFIIGSLAGDSLVRHAFGGCLYAAGRIIDPTGGRDEKHQSKKCIERKEALLPQTPPGKTPNGSGTSSPMLRSNGSTHQDLHLDRRKLARKLDSCQWTLEA